MTEDERKVLERNAGRTDPSIAFKLGKIVAIDEIISLIEDTLKDDRGISGKALAITVFIIYGDVKKRLRDEVIAAYEN